MLVFVIVERPDDVVEVAPHALARRAEAPIHEGAAKVPMSEPQVLPQSVSQWI